MVLAGDRGTREEGKMVEKDLLPLESNDYVVFALTFLASALGAAGGIGGGGIMVPMLVSIGGFRCYFLVRRHTAPRPAPSADGCCLWLQRASCHSPHAGDSVWRRRHEPRSQCSKAASRCVLASSSLSSRAVEAGVFDYVGCCCVHRQTLTGH